MTGGEFIASHPDFGSERDIRYLDEFVPGWREMSLTELQEAVTAFRTKALGMVDELLDLYNDLGESR